MGGGKRVLNDNAPSAPPSIWSQQPSMEPHISTFNMHPPASQCFHVYHQAFIEPSDYGNRGSSQVTTVDMYLASCQGYADPSSNYEGLALHFPPPTPWAPGLAVDTH